MKSQFKRMMAVFLFVDIDGIIIRGYGSDAIRTAVEERRGK